MAIQPSQNASTSASDRSASNSTFGAQSDRPAGAAASRKIAASPAGRSTCATASSPAAARGTLLNKVSEDVATSGNSEASENTAACAEPRSSNRTAPDGARP